MPLPWRLPEYMLSKCSTSSRVWFLYTVLHLAKANPIKPKNYIAILGDMGEAE
jgi:hypothetical protein